MQIGDEVQIVSANGGWEGHITKLGNGTATVHSKGGLRGITCSKNRFIGNGKGWTVTFL